MTSPLAFRLEGALRALTAAETEHYGTVQGLLHPPQRRANANGTRENLRQAQANMDLLLEQLRQEEYLLLYTVTQAEAFIVIMERHLEDRGNLRGARIVRSSQDVEADIRRIIIGDLHEYYFLDELPAAGAANELNGPNGNGNQGGGGPAAGVVNGVVADENQVANGPNGNPGNEGAVDADQDVELEDVAEEYDEDVEIVNVAGLDEDVEMEGAAGPDVGAAGQLGAY